MATYTREEWKAELRRRKAAGEPSSLVSRSNKVRAEGDPAKPLVTVWDHFTEAWGYFVGVLMIVCVVAAFLLYVLYFVCIGFWWDAFTLSNDVWTAPTARKANYIYDDCCPPQDTSTGNGSGA